MVTIEAIIETPDETLPEIPWVNSATDEWHTKLPVLFELSDARTTTRAQGWAAVSAEGILLRIAAHDDAHVNTNTGAAIWDGDCVQIGIDAYPPAGEGFDQAASFATAFTGAYAFALTGHGAEAWCYYHGERRRTGTRADLLKSPPQNADAANPHGFQHGSSSVTRDVEQRITRYDLVFPWREFNSHAGIACVLGLAVQLNDKHPTLGEVRMHWGEGAGGAIKPGKFMRVRVAPPPAEVFEGAMAAAAVTRRVLWSANDVASAVCFVRPFEQYKVLVRTRADTKDEWRDVIETPAPGATFEVRWRPENDTDEAMLVIVLYRYHARSGYWCAIHVQRPEAPVKRIRGCAELLRPLARSALEKRHLKDYVAIAEAAWSAAAADPGAARLVFEALERFEQPLAVASERSRGTILWSGVPRTWGNYFVALEADRPKLPLAVKSSADGSVQTYLLGRPTKEGAGPCPLIVYLHGSGDPQVLNFAMGGEVAAATRAAVAEAYIVEPWGRGNAWYQGAAGQDVWDVIDDVKKHFPIDPKRVFLCGHSMGGFGTLALALQRPEMFAAVAICAGAKLQELAEDQRLATLAMPVLLWHGADDALAPVRQTMALRAAMERAGRQPQVEIVSGHGHSMTAAQQAGVFAWLLRQPAHGELPPHTLD